MPSPVPSRPRPRRILLFAAGCLITLAAAIIGIGSIRTDTGFDVGAVVYVNDAATRTPAIPTTLPTTFRVATMNIHSGIGTSNREDLALTAKTLEGIDVACLNEVRGALVGPTQVEQLETLTGLMGEYFPSERQYWHDAFGNALLSRLPLRGWQRTPLPSGLEGSRRNVTIVGLVNDQLTVIITHLARHKDHSAQLDHVSRLFLEQKPPVILMGDMNTTSDSPLMSELLATEGVRNPLDEKHPELRGKHIDWILVRGLDVRDAGIRDLGASDHPLVWAELAFPSPATQATQPSGILQTTP